jgi:hypothetical protein
MNNSTIFTADRTTHLKIVVMSLVASILVAGVGIAARSTSMDTSHVASGPAIKAGKPIAVTNSGTTVVR